MEVNDTKKALLTNELQLQTGQLSAIVDTSSDTTNNINTDTIQLSDEWTNDKNLFTNTKVEKVAKTSIADLVNVPSGVVYDTVNDTLTFVDESLTKYFSSSCKIPNTNSITLNELVSDINVFETLDKINNFGDVYDFQFRQIDFGTHKYANVKSFVTFEKILGYFSIDKLINDELVRKNNQDFLYSQYYGTDQAKDFPPYDGFLIGNDYIQNGWVSLDQIIRNIYKDEYAYDKEASISIRTPKIISAKKALITLSLSYVCDIFNLNSFNKLSDFGIRIVDRTTGVELSVTNTKSELIEKIANTIIATYSGNLSEPSTKTGNDISQKIETADTSCKKIKTNKCDGSLFTTSDKQNALKESMGFIHDIDAQIRINPFKELLLSKPDILNTIDPIHWTTGVDNLTQTGELFNLIKEFGSNTYKSGKLNQDRAFAYSAGEFTNGLTTGGYSHNSTPTIIETTNKTESWNGISWTIRAEGECPVASACGLAGGNQDLSVIAYGIKNEWYETDKTYDTFFVPSKLNEVMSTPLIFQNNTWRTINDLSPSVARHSVAGKLNIKYDESVPGESIDKLLDKKIFDVCNDAISQAKQFASQKQTFESVTDSISGSIETPNISPRVWFDVWQCNGIAFGGSNSEHLPLDEIRERIPGTENQNEVSGITDEFESISWIHITKNTKNPESNDKIEESQTYGCWFVDTERKYPIKAMGVSYVGTNTSGLATGGKTSNPLSNSVLDNVKVNMKNYYFDAAKFDIENLSVTPHCFENNGISWIRREDLPEAVYYHAGVGDSEYALFFGGIHSSLETPQVYTSFKNCQDWETLINVYGGSFARNGSFSIDGNIRYSSFSNLYDGNSKGAEDSYGNTYFKNMDTNNTESSTVIYSEEYKNSGNIKVTDSYPDISNFQAVQDPEFTFPNKQIHTKVYSKLTYNYVQNYFVVDVYALTYDLVFDKKIVDSFEHIVINRLNKTISVKVSNFNKAQVLQYFSELENISLVADELLISANSFRNGTNKLITISEESPSVPGLDIFEDKLTNSNVDRNGKFTFYFSNNTEKFLETYIENQPSLPTGVAANKENYFLNLSTKYSGHPGEGGMWLVSRPTVAEILFDPKNFLNNQVSRDEIIAHGFNQQNDVYTYFVKKAIMETYDNGDTYPPKYANYKDSGLYQYLLKNLDDYSYTVNELWHNRFNLNDKLFIDIKKKISKDGYIASEQVKLDRLPMDGTESVGTFSNMSATFAEILEDFTKAQFENTDIPSLNVDLIHVQMYDNDTSGYIGNGGVKTSSIRDKAGLWPWVDLLDGDPSNDCVVGRYTYRWDMDGNVFFAKVKNVEWITGDDLKTYKKETITITKYLNNGKKSFDYEIVYKEKLNSEILPTINRDRMVFAGSGTQSFAQHIAAKQKEYDIYNIFGKSLKRHEIVNNKFNSLHIYGSKQNYEITDRTVLSYNWDKVCSDDFNTSNISDYPFKYTNLCELIKENDLYNETTRYQVYIEGYNFGDTPVNVSPVEPWFNPKYYREYLPNRTIIPPQILTEDGCGIRENLARMRYNSFSVPPANIVIFGDVRIMGELTDNCDVPSNCSIIACGDTPNYNKDYSGLIGQPEYYINNLTSNYNLNWTNTGIATDFTSNLYARFRRDAVGDDILDSSFLTLNNLDKFPYTHKDDSGTLWTPLDIARNPQIETGSKTLYAKPGAIVFQGGVFDIMYDKNFYETIYCLEEMAKMALEKKIWMIFLTIPPRAMMQYEVAIENYVWYNNLVGDGRLDDTCDTPRMSVKESPVTGDSWNIPMTIGPYAGLTDPFIGKTKLEKLVAINEWMKETLTKYNHTVLDLYDHLADKNAAAIDQHVYKFDAINNEINMVSGSVYGFIKDEYTNGRFANTELTQFNGLLTNVGNSAIMNFLYELVDLKPRLNVRIMDFDGKIIDPIKFFNYDNPEFPASRSNPATYFDLQKVGVPNTYLAYDKLSDYNINELNINDSVDLAAEESDSFPIVKHKVAYESLYFDLLCCLLKQDTGYTTCYSSICDILGDNISDEKYKWVQHNHEEWTVPILESPFAGPFSTDEFNVWLASGNIKNNRWGTNIWSSIENGKITLHHKKQRIGINDPQAGYALEDGKWIQIEKSADRGHLYYAIITAEVQIENIEIADSIKPSPCRIFYDEFIFDLSAYSEPGLDAIVKEIVKISYPDYTGLETPPLPLKNNIIPLDYKFNTKYEILGLEIDENLNAYKPEESQLNAHVSGENLCTSDSFAYTEWATNFVQEMRNKFFLRQSVDQKENKYFLKYDINRPFGSTTFKDSEAIELTSDVKIVDTEWRRYQDGVGMGGDAPILNVSSDNQLTCNNLNSWFIGQSAFGTPDRAIVFGGFEFPANGGSNSSHIWWENLTTNLTFKWNKFVISPEDTFNANYAKRSFSTTFTNKEPTTAKSSMGMIMFDLTNNVLVERQGTVVFDKQNKATVRIDLTEIINNKDKYSITLTPSDNITCWWENKTEKSFDIVVDVTEWSGSIEWFVTINDSIQVVNPDPNASYNSYEEI